MELLVSIADKCDHVGSTKRGDVIEICPDGWGWSDAELNHPDWRVIRSPIPQTLINTLKKSFNHNKVLAVKRYRDWHINLDLLDPSIFQSGGIIDVPRSELTHAVVKK